MSNEQLVELIQKGENKEENICLLWEQNKGLIRKLSCSFCEYAEREDLEQEGFIGLCDAAMRYNPKYGDTFYSYAAIWVKQRMSRYVRSNGMIRIPEYAISRLLDFYKISREWRMKYNRLPTDQEVMKHLKLSYEQVCDIKENILVNKVESLDVPVGEAEDTNMYDLIPGNNSVDEILEIIQQEQLKKILWRLVDELTTEQAIAIRERFQKERTLEDVGNKLGISVNRASSIIAKALRELRRPEKRNQLQPFWDDYIYSQALNGTGVKRFKETWTSSTERVALDMIKTN